MTEASSLPAEQSSGRLLWGRRDSDPAGAIAMLIPTVSAAAVPQATDQAIVLMQSSEHAFGQFSPIDSSGCVRTEVTVFAADLVDQQPPGPPDKRSLLLFIRIFQFDDCRGMLLHNAEGIQELDDTAFKVSNSPMPARLTTSLTMSNGTSGNFDVNVDLTWSAAERPDPVRDTVHFELAPGCKVTAHVSNAFRSATVSGTVSDGTTNFTPQPGEGFVDYQKAGQVTLGGDALPTTGTPLTPLRRVQVEGSPFAVARSHSRS
jgi:hypothetical protein